MNFLEKDLEEIIYEAPREELRKRGLYLSGTIVRQLKIGAYGKADLVTFHHETEIHYPEQPKYSYADQTLHITVYELKKDKADYSAFTQALKYATGINHWLQKGNRFQSFNIKFWFVLIGSSICRSEFCYLPSHMDNLDVYTYIYDFDGIKFNHESGYKLSNPGF